MEEYADKVSLDTEEMFTLGLLHDIGYEFGGSEEHHVIGDEILKKQNYKYYNGVLYHGKPNDEYTLSALNPLNLADMHIDKLENYVSFEDRLNDIKNRRVEDSPHYKNFKIVMEDLISKGFIA